MKLLQSRKGFAIQASPATLHTFLEMAHALQEHWLGGWRLWMLLVVCAACAVPTTHLLIMQRSLHSLQPSV